MRSLMLIGVFTLFLGCAGDEVVQQNQQESNSSKTESHLNESAVDSGVPKVIDIPVEDLDSIEVHVEEPTTNAPVVFGAAITPSSLGKGDVATLVIRAKIAEPWHIYSVDGPTGVGRATKLEFESTDDVFVGSNMKLPTAETNESALGPVSVYHGDIRFGVPVQISETAKSGNFEIKCKLYFQACTDSQCLRPSSTNLTIPVEVVAH